MGRPPFHRRDPSAGITVLLAGLFFLSGFAGLGYEIIWTRIFAIGLGAEILAMLAVLAAFFAGFGLGAWALDGKISRSRVPGRWYAAAEAVIGAWALVLLIVIPAVNRMMPALLGLNPRPVEHLALAFCATFICLLPATFAMGATLPAMDRLFSRIRAHGRSIGGLYAINTLGAVAGVLGATFILLPRIGFRLSFIFLASINLLCAAAIFRISGADEQSRPEIDEPMAERPNPFRLKLMLFGTGLLGIGYEVLGVRVLSQVLENTIYSFASTLAVYLIGTAAGGALYQKWAAKAGGKSFLSILFPALSSSCLLGLIALSESGALYQSIHAALGGGMAAAIGAEMATAGLVFLLPTLLMGAVFSHLAQSARTRVGGVGRALAINTLGAALAPFLFGWILLPRTGAGAALMIVGTAYLLLLPVYRSRAALLGLIPLLLLPLLPHSFHLIQPPPGGRLVALKEGVMAAVSVVQDADGGLLLKVNNRFRMGGTPSAFGERRMGRIPLLLHPHSKRALFLGLGTAITFGAAGDHPGVMADGVELIPEIIDLLPYFRDVNGDPQSRPQLHLAVADARRYIQAVKEPYDVIVADLFHPARDGAGSLYTLEHFQMIRDDLKPEGLFCQWLPLYQMDLDLLRTIIQTFQQVFPEPWAFLAHYNALTPALGLVGRVESHRYPPDILHAAYSSPGFAEVCRREGISGALDLFGCLIADPDDLIDLAAGAPLNTDNLPLVTFTAPRFVYRSGNISYTLLETLLERCQVDPGPLFQPAAAEGDPSFLDRLGLFLEARDIYLRGDMRRIDGDEDGAIELYVRSAGVTPDFRTGYDIALLMARRRAGANPGEARAILEDLIRSRPSRPEARRLLQESP